jgi:DNA modification methylase|uniref:DNA methylase N-4/N-6 domain-containing protein n=1 Tax=viral metagenome TaxID=1070528 RepID=A0A6C0IQ06_9ZZZZ
MEKNTYYVEDNLVLLKKVEKESVDLIYFDPPYNTGRDFYNFNDKFESVDAYSDFIKLRIIECRRILKKTGTMIVHIEPRVSPYFRLIADALFGLNNFKNEIVWKTGGNSKNIRQLNRWHDTILVYAKNKGKQLFNPIYFPYDDAYKKNAKICPIHKKLYKTTAIHNSQPEVNPRMNLRYEWQGNTRQWYVCKEKMEELHKDNRLQYNNKNIPRIKRFLDEMDGIPLRDIWDDIANIQSKEKLKYATQKPVKLLERIVTLYSDEKSLCLDIFAGSGTLGRACKNLNRDYILFDINEDGKKLFEKSI